MSIVLLFIASLLMLVASLLSEQRKFFVTAWTGIVTGCGYFVWGVVGTSGVPDNLVNANDPIRMKVGAGLVVFGLLLLAFHWYRDLRRRYPRQ